MVRKYAVRHGESKLKEIFATVTECCEALCICTCFAVYVLSGGGFFFFVELALILRKRCF